jgi:hypothetical protein
MGSHRLSNLWIRNERIRFNLFRTTPQEHSTASTTSLPLLWMVTGTGLSPLQEHHQWLPLTQPQFVILSHTSKELTLHVTWLQATLKPLQDVYRQQHTPLPGLLT